MNVEVRNHIPPRFRFSIVHMGMASPVVMLMLYQFWNTHAFPYPVFALLAGLFAGLQIMAWWFSRTRGQITQSNWLFISAFLLCILVIPVFVHSAQWTT